MPDSLDHAQPFVAAIYHERCPACGRCNRVQVTQQYGHNQSLDYYCAHCRQRLGCISELSPPATSIVEHTY